MILSYNIQILHSSSICNPSCILQCLFFTDCLTPLVKIFRIIWITIKIPLYLIFPSFLALFTNADTPLSSHIICFPPTLITPKSDMPAEYLPLEFLVRIGSHQMLISNLIPSETTLNHFTFWSVFPSTSGSPFNFQTKK